VYFTALPKVGVVVTQGESLYSVNGTPVTLFYGSTPAWRTLNEGLSGPDVAQLNADLVSLGCATAAQLGSSDYFSSVTATALTALQSHLAVATTGTLTLGQAVFLPGPARITSVTAALGTTAHAGSTVLAATSITRQVTATADATQISQLHVGDPVSITLPDGRTTPGTVTSIGTTSTAASSSSSGSSTPATVNVGITPTDPAATGVVDQATVTVTVTIATVKSTLAVPVAALVTTPDGRPAVAVGTGKFRYLVPVTVALFDDANGLIQIQTSSLHVGQPIDLSTATHTT
jgi:hypothetical protein